MSVYSFIPALMYALGVAHTTLLYRERVARLKAERTAARAERDLARSDRNEALISLANRVDGGTYRATSLHPSNVSRLPRQAER